jgi:L-asparaginase / beta-aspartyl-peptidase
MSKFTLAIHGGAGTILRSEMTGEMEAAYKAALNDALNSGFEVLGNKGTAIESVKAAVISLENNILFNAGRGSVFTKDGLHEMDAAIMDGSNLNAGAVAAVRNIRNPVELAIEVMNKSNHVLLSGTGANEFAKKQGIAFESDDYFFSEFRFNQWQSMKHSDSYALDHSTMDSSNEFKDKKFGTVGAVACDVHGNIAAATSTGGMTNKMYGRIGDSPLIGIGTYANNKTCAISCTGHGEPFIRAVTAYDVSCLMEYKGLSLEDAVKTVVHDKLIRIEGEGGLIAVDAKGNHSLMFNSDGMYRGFRSSDGSGEVLIYK